jgi:hypothetical protein
MPAFIAFIAGIEVHEVRRDDEDVIQLLVFGQRGVGRDHLVVGAVALDGVRPVGGFFQRDLGIGKQRARNHAAGAVEVNGFWCGWTMKAPLPPPTKPTLRGLLDIYDFSCLCNC